MEFDDVAVGEYVFALDLLTGRGIRTGDIGVYPVHAHELIGIWVGERFDQYTMDQAKHRGVRPDAEPECDHGGQGEARFAQQAPRRHSKIVEEATQPHLPFSTTGGRAVRAAGAAGAAARKPDDYGHDMPPIRERCEQARSACQVVDVILSCIAQHALSRDPAWHKPPKEPFSQTRRVLSWALHRFGSPRTFSKPCQSLNNASRDTCSAPIPSGVTSNRRLG